MQAEFLAMKEKGRKRQWSKPSHSSGSLYSSFDHIQLTKTLCATCSVAGRQQLHPLQGLLWRGDFWVWKQTLQLDLESCRKTLTQSAFLSFFGQDELSHDLLGFASESLRDGGRLVFLVGCSRLKTGSLSMCNTYSFVPVEHSVDLS